jgi:hypothetical protein
MSEKKFKRVGWAVFELFSNPKRWEMAGTETMGRTQKMAIQYYEDKYKADFKKEKTDGFSKCIPLYVEVSP